MKLPIAVLLCAASVVACSHESHPNTVPMAEANPTPARRVEPTPVVETSQEDKPTRVLPGMPTDSPQVAPPAAAAPPPSDDSSLALTPASGNGAPRAVSPQMVQTDPARDKPETAQDEQSIREIRALLASDRALAPISPQVTIAVRGGRVWLRGQVNTAGERAAIEKAARRAGGVLDVKNELVVME